MASPSPSSHLTSLFSESPMDPNTNFPMETPKEEEERANQETLKLPLSSISLSLSSTFLSPQTQLQSKPSFSPFIINLKIPNQITSLTLTTTTTNKPSSRNNNNKSSSSYLTPLQSPLPLLPRRHSHPSSLAAGRRTTILWFRFDLRLHDNEALSAAHSDSLSLLPVFLFDPRDFGKSPSGFDRTGPFRAQFLLSSVQNLRSSLRSRGSDLLVRIGRPETVLPELVRSVGADAVYAHREVSHDEARAEERVEKAMEEEEGVEVKYFWGSTLYHVEDLPFDLENMPSNYGGFREKLKGVSIRKTIDALDDVRGMPKMGDVDVGEMPTLLDLGLSQPPPTGLQDGKSVMGTSLVGGETEALDRLKKFALECSAQPKTEGKDGARDSIYGANFSCKISPWLATGSLSPRFMFEELKKSAHRTISASNKKKGASGADDGMNWLMFELLWRDFFRFITKKYSSRKRKTEGVPSTACAGAIA